MKYRIQIIFFLIFLIICQNSQNDDDESKENDIEVSDSKENEDIKEIPLDPSKKIGYNIQVDDENIQSIEIESIEFREPVDLSDEEMDTILLCAYLSQQALKTKFKDDIIKIAEKIGEFDTKKVYDKLGSEFMENCINDIEPETVNIYISNLTYHNNFKWEKQFDNYTIIDYDKYNSTSDLKYTVEQQVLLRFLKQSNEEFEKRKKMRRNIQNVKEPEKAKEQKNDKIMNKHFTNRESIIKANIWKEIRFFISFMLILLSFVGIIYFLKKISAKKDTKKNIKNKTENIKNEKSKKKKID